MTGSSGVLRLTARWVPPGALKPFGRPVALVFHGVVRRIEDARIEVNQHTADDFAALAKILKAEFDVLPLDALEDVLGRPERYPNAVFLTADDGYKSMLTVAADILDGLQLPWSLFVSTRHIDSGEPNPLFLARLFFYFAPAGRHGVPNFPEAVTLGEDRAAIASAGIAHLKTLEAGKAREAIAVMTSAIADARMKELMEGFQSERFLSWPEVAALAARGVEIGAHACWHWPMNAAQPHELLAREARVARNSVAQCVGRCRYFAYPFGNARDVTASAWRAVRDAGYSYAFTTMSATLDASSNAWLLPRYALRPQERNLPSLLPMLRAGNPRLAYWQRELARRPPEHLSLPK